MQLEIKRLHLPGFTISVACSSCDETLTWDGDVNSIPYPLIGEPETIELYCSECDIEVSRTVELNLSITTEDGVFSVGEGCWVDVFGD